MKLATRKETHIARKIWHVLGVGTMLWLYYILPYQVALGVGTGLCVVLITLDSIRLKFPPFKKLIMFFMRPFMREEERNKFTGLSWMCLGFWALILLFERNIVILTMFFVMLGDPLAAYIGTKYGKDKIGDKSLQGFLACFVACMIVAFIHLRITDFNSARILYAGLLAGLFGSVSELIQIPNVDDNLSMPLLSGLSLYLLFNVIA